MRLPGLAPGEREALGFGLATLEFAASAARDQELSEAFGKRLARILAGFEAVARRGHRDDDPLSAEQLGSMLMAFDQGAAIHWLTGQMVLEADMMREVMNGMLRPAGLT